MKLNPVLAAALAGACGLASSAAHADALSWDPSFAFSGFGTIGYARTDTTEALFANPGQHSGVSTDGGFGPDSKIGGQINAKANSMFSATVQAISARNGNGNFKPSLEWAFVKAQATPELAFRAGRIGAPLFAISDYRNVNYSNLWVRPPLDVYAQVILNHFDGADAIYQKSLGATTVTVQVYGGRSTAITNQIPVQFKHEIGMNVTAEFDNGITLRAGRVQGKINAQYAPVAQLVAILETTPFASIGQEIDMTNKAASFTSFGASYDHENLVGSVEYTWRKTASLISDTTGWAATGGYRLGTWTPFVVVSKVKVDSTNVTNTIPAGVPALAALSAAVNGTIATQNLAQKTVSAGLRWDVYKNIDIKAQYDRIKPNGGTGFFLEPKPGFGHSTVSVYSISADFVF